MSGEVLTKDQQEFLEAGRTRPVRCLDCGKYFGMRYQGQRIGFCAAGQKDEEIVKAVIQTHIVETRTGKVDAEGREIVRKSVAVVQQEIVVSRPQIFDGIDPPPDSCTADSYWNFRETRKFYSRWSGQR